MTKNAANNERFRAVFPYGVFDEEGVRQFLSMHEAKRTTFEVRKEIEWFANAEPTVNMLVPRVNGQPAQIEAISDLDISNLR
jgi:hypothetical protein